MVPFCYFLAWEWINISLEYTAVAWMKLPRFFFACVAVNLLTHPIFTLFLLRFGRAFATTCLCEFVIFVVETAILTAIYGRKFWRRTMLAAFVMNVVSFGTGLLIGLSYEGNF